MTRPAPAWLAAALCLTHVSTITALLDAGASAEISILEGQNAVALARKLNPARRRAHGGALLAAIPLRPDLYQAAGG